MSRVQWDLDGRWLRCRMIDIDDDAFRRLALLWGKSHDRGACPTCGSPATAGKDAAQALYEILSPPDYLAKRQRKVSN